MCSKDMGWRRRTGGAVAAALSWLFRFVFDVHAVCVGALLFEGNPWMNLDSIFVLYRKFDFELCHHYNF